MMVHCILIKFSKLCVDLWRIRSLLSIIIITHKRLIFDNYSLDYEINSIKSKVFLIVENNGKFYKPNIFKN